MTQNASLGKPTGSPLLESFRAQPERQGTLPGRAPSLVTKYVGLPFEDLGRSVNGVDCWGLVQHVYRSEYKIHLPDYKMYGSIRDRAAVEVTARFIKARWQQNSEPAFMDVICFNIAKRPLHVGLVVSKDQFLHSPEDDFTRIERFTDRIWANRIEGFYRYVL